MLTPDELEWGDIASMAPPAQIAVIEGDLSAEEPFTVRLLLPDGYEVLPHVHAALPWTADWRALWRGTVAAGVPMRENPVAALLKEAGARAPQDLDTAWARAVDRRNRAAGRADLARTFEANLGRLDALHAILGLARSGLLPPRLGPLRPGRSPD